MPDTHQHLLAEVLQQCRASASSPLRETITQLVGGAISETIGVELAPVDTWVAHLWNGNRRRLEPAFGTFPPESWGIDFEYGEGVVGHAFRMRAPAVYFSELQPSSREKYLSRLIYRPGPSRAMRWVACVPIWSKPNVQHGAMGVIGFSMTAGAAPSRMQRKLEHIARNFAMSPPAKWSPDDGSERREKLTALALSTSFMFWEALQYATTLEEHADFIRTAVHDHWHRDRMSDVAPKPGAPSPPAPPRRKKK